MIEGTVMVFPKNSPRVSSCWYFPLRSEKQLIELAQKGGDNFLITIDAITRIARARMSGIIHDRLICRSEYPDLFNLFLATIILLGNQEGESRRS